MERTFRTPEPIELVVEIGSGSVDIHTSDGGETRVEVKGPSADDVVVEQRGRQIVIVAPRRISFSSRSVDVDVTVPVRSDVSTRLGSADLTANGSYGNVKLRSGSGDVTVDNVSGDAQVKAGSGDVKVGTFGGPASLTSGSGDVEVDRSEAALQVSTGSGDVLVGHATANLAVKSGSGDVEVRQAQGETQLVTASGDVRVGSFPHGRLTATNASGDIRIGIPAGVPVWTDVNTMTGRVRSTLTGAGEPISGQDHVEVRARTVSGDVHLQEL